jgi:protein-glutamine gamma-glutamyltransferase
MAILLRAAGVPTRLVTGYGPGDRNPFTGYQEVRFSDAHAWVEVYYRSVGWVPYDPTFGVPEARPGWSSRFVAPEVLAAVGRFVGRVLPGPLKTGLSAAGRALAAAAGGARRAWPVALLVGALGVAAAWAWRRHRRRRARGPGATDKAGRAFEDLVKALTPVGHARGPAATPSEYLAGVASDPKLQEEVWANAEVVVRTFERVRFAPPEAQPHDDELAQARAAASRVAELVGRR